MFKENTGTKIVLYFEKYLPACKHLQIAQKMPKVVQGCNKR